MKNQPCPHRHRRKLLFPFSQHYQVKLLCVSINLVFTSISGVYHSVVRLAAHTLAGVSVFVSNATNNITSFSVTTFSLYWNNDSVRSLVPCESSSMVLMSGVWAPNMTGLVTFHLQSSWLAKMTVDHVVLIETDAANSYQTATFSATTSFFHEIKIEFVCLSPFTSSFVSLK